MSKRTFITATDQFCGAGGSSIGATKAGVELKLALNHWKLAVDTHNTNFPNAAHDCTDISACDPRRYPSTDILITSPECTNHSLANGKKKPSKQFDMFNPSATRRAKELAAQREEKLRALDVARRHLAAMEAAGSGESVYAVSARRRIEVLEKEVSNG